MLAHGVLIGPVVPFFISPWIMKVRCRLSIWESSVFGRWSHHTLILKGHEIRHMVIWRLNSDEEAQMLTASKRDLESHCFGYDVGEDRKFNGGYEIFS